MVLPILVAIITAPALLGTQEAIRQSQAKEKREEHRARRCNLIASCVKSSMRSREINGRPIVLRDGKLWIDTGTSDGDPLGHPYAGYYLPYPDSKYEGLVTTITDVAPIMNWVYIDKDTYEVKYGVRVDAQPNHTGPFDCTRQDRRLTFDGWEGWCAVEEFPSLWALYFDKDDDGLRSKIAPGTRVLEIELTRKEKRWQKETEARQQDQTTQRAVDTKEDAPVDDPVTAQPELNPPGVSVEPSKPLEPLPLPKSIFSDPPRPLFFAPQVPQPPKTPPPAYSANASSAPPPPAQAANTSSTPGPSTSPQAPMPLQPTPPNEKRVIPKINRNSGTRALAQAQMFEAMALGQKPNNDTPFRNNQSPSRPASNATSVSEYSNPPKTGVTDIFEMYGDRDSTLVPANTPPPIPRLDKAQAAEQPPMPASDPAVFGGFSTGGGSRTDDSSKGPTPLRRKNSFRANPISDAPKALPPPLPSSSEEGGQRRQSPGRRPPGARATDRRPPPTTAAAGRTRTVSPEDRRPLQSSRDVARDNVLRSTPRSQNARYSPPRQRNASASSQQSQSQSQTEGRSSPSTRPLTRTNTAPVRKSMAATMTSGARNRGMAIRFSGEDKMPDMPSRSQTQRTRTTSKLMREIDELVSQETATLGGGRGRSGSASSRGDEMDRPPPLRRAVTSRVPVMGSGFKGRRNRDSLEKD